MRCPVCEYYCMRSEVIEIKSLYGVKLKKVSFVCPECGYKNERVIA